jgi:hypothetical protein
MKVSYFLFILLLSVVFSSCNHNNEENDFALLTQRDQWSHEYALGSPTWDTLERFSNNPVYRGSKGLEWPVNGFLFSDPMSHKWYLYIGEYKENYSSDQDIDTADFNCVIYESEDRGKTWSSKGNLFPANMVSYDSIKIQAPDVMVTYVDGEYHMVFDWVPADFNWQSSEKSGIGYAVADSPEGPFVVSNKPIKLNTQYKHNQLLDRYSRMYAPMIVKRKKDWALLYMMDTSPARSWVLAVSTSPKPEGPYGETNIMLNVESKSNYQPLQEFYPAFTHDGYVYFPSTSVAINRNYQAVHRVKVEDLTKANSYELFSDGGFWHSENVENEDAGIWGQTITGFIDKDSIYVMFPSKDPKNYGTINLAKASWNKLFRERGFSLTTNKGNTFSYIKKAINVEEINMEFRLDGKMHVIWDFNSPLDKLDGWGKFTLNHNYADYKEVVIDKSGWQINVYESGKNMNQLDSGAIKDWKKDGNQLLLQKMNGEFQLSINGLRCWRGELTNRPGIIGLALDPNSFLFANRLIVEGPQVEGFVTYGFYEALVNSGNQDSDWDFKTDSLFLYGKGAVSKKDSSFAKWNFEGKGFEIYAPRGPLYGTVHIYLDGKLVKVISLKNEKDLKSRSIYKSLDISTGKHAVYLETLDGLLPLD